MNIHPQIIIIEEHRRSEALLLHPLVSLILAIQRESVCKSPMPLVVYIPEQYAQIPAPKVTKHYKH